MVVKRTACSHNCWDVCVLDVTVRDNRIVDISGVDNDIMRGFCCSKARDLAARISDANRPVTPYMRKNKADKLQPVTWDEALTRVCAELLRAVEVDSRSILYHASSGSQGLLQGIDRLFWDRIGPVTMPGGSLCWSGGLSAQRLDFGGVCCHDPLDHINASTIVIWGRNPAETNLHLMPILGEARSRGARVVCIDPIRTRTAAWSDDHISIKPGTDYLLAAAVCREIIASGADFSDDCDGYDGFVSLLQTLPAIQDIALKTGVSVEAIRDLARLYGDRPVASVIGYGMQRYRTGGLAVRLIDAIGVLSGNVGIAGGGVNYASFAVRESFDPLPLTGTVHDTIPWPQFADGVSRSDIKVLFVSRSNPISQLPAAAWTRAVLSSIPFVVVCDNRWTDTALMADVVLPVQVSYEHADILHSTWHNYVTYCERAVAPPYGVRSDVEIWSELADRLGIEPINGDHEYWLRHMTSSLAQQGYGWDNARGSTFRHPCADMVAWKHGFMTDSGRCKLVERADWDDLERTSREFGLRLISPKHRLAMHSQFYERIEDGLCRVFLSRVTASAYGVSDGDKVKVCSAQGGIVCRVVIDERIRDDVVMIYPGGSLGKGMCVNAVVPYAGTDLGDCVAYYECAVRLEKVDE